MGEYHSYKTKEQITQSVYTRNANLSGTPEYVQWTVFIVGDQVIAWWRHSNTGRTHQLTGQVTITAKPKPKLACHRTEHL